MRFSSDDLQALARTLQLPSLLRGVFAEQTRAQLWEGNDHPQAETGCSDVTVRARVRRGWARVGSIRYDDAQDRLSRVRYRQDLRLARTKSVHGLGPAPSWWVDRWRSRIDLDAKRSPVSQFQ